MDELDLRMKIDYLASELDKIRRLFELNNSAIVQAFEMIAKQSEEISHIFESLTELTNRVSNNPLSDLDKRKN
jgi:hypothetical protein